MAVLPKKQRLLFVLGKHLDDRGKKQFVAGTHRRRHGHQHVACVCVRLTWFSRAVDWIVDAQEKAMLSRSVGLRLGSASQSDSHPAGYEQSLLT